ncbi:MAG: hypothetical protein Q9202_002641 [Teloschistes flavicans]
MALPLTSSTQLAKDPTSDPLVKGFGESDPKSGEVMPPKRADVDPICRSGEQKEHRGKPFGHQPVNVFVATTLNSLD